MASISKGTAEKEGFLLTYLCFVRKIPIHEQKIENRKKSKKIFPHLKNCIDSVSIMLFAGEIMSSPAPDENP